MRHIKVYETFDDDIFDLGTEFGVYGSASKELLDAIDESGGAPESSARKLKDLVNQAVRDGFDKEAAQLRTAIESIEGLTDFRTPKMGHHINWDIVMVTYSKRAILPNGDKLTVDWTLSVPHHMNRDQILVRRKSASNFDETGEAREATLLNEHGVFKWGLQEDALGEHGVDEYLSYDEVMKALREPRLWKFRKRPNK